MNGAIEYKYNEDKLLEELREYINSTYSSHYSKSKKYQSIDAIFSSGNGRGFCIGNIQKYADRLYSKGTIQDARTDLIKIIHYALFALYDHDQNHPKIFTTGQFQPVQPISETQKTVQIISDCPSYMVGNTTTGFSTISHPQKKGLI